jgi:hypothetical protein
MAELAAPAAAGFLEAFRSIPDLPAVSEAQVVLPEPVLLQALDMQGD